MSEREVSRLLLRLKRKKVEKKDTEENELDACWFEYPQQHLRISISIAYETSARAAKRGSKID